MVEKETQKKNKVYIEIMTYGHAKWEKTIEFAENCSWKAGAFLAEKMKANQFEDNERVLIAIANGEPVAFCVFSNYDELSLEYEFTPFIGFMFVDENYRGHRLSGKLIDAACNIARSQGFSKIYIMSGEIGLYEKYVFLKLGDYRTIYDSVEQLFAKKI